MGEKSHSVRGAPIQGLLMCDMDGTLSFQGAEISQDILRVLEQFSVEGWAVVFATGRTKSWALKHLEGCSFPYHIASFNGSCLWGQGEQLVYSHCLSRSLLFSMNPAIEKMGAVIYEDGARERIFSTPRFYSDDVEEHLARRREKQKESWTPLDSLEELPSDVQEIASIRFFMKAAELCQSSQFLQSLVSEEELAMPSMKDSFDPSMRIIQVTARDATKAAPIREIHKIYGRVPVIAIGDDINDYPMLKASDYAIAIQGAPDILLDICDAVTAAASSSAVVSALLGAKAHISKHRNNERKKR